MPSFFTPLTPPPLLRLLYSLAPDPPPPPSQREPETLARQLSELLAALDAALPPGAGAGVINGAIRLAGLLARPPGDVAADLGALGGCARMGDRGRHAEGGGACRQVIPNCPPVCCLPQPKPNQPINPINPIQHGQHIRRRRRPRDAAGAALDAVVARPQRPRAPAREAGGARRDARAERQRVEEKGGGRGSVWEGVASGKGHILLSLSKRRHI